MCSYISDSFIITLRLDEGSLTYFRLNSLLLTTIEPEITLITTHNNRCVFFVIINTYLQG